MTSIPGACAATIAALAVFSLVTFVNLQEWWEHSKIDIFDDRGTLIGDSEPHFSWSFQLLLLLRKFNTENSAGHCSTRQQIEQQKPLLRVHLCYKLSADGRLCP
jgi:hypothetical protein